MSNYIFNLIKQWEVPLKNAPNFKFLKMSLNPNDWNNQKYTKIKKSLNIMDTFRTHTKK